MTRRLIIAAALCLAACSSSSSSTSTTGSTGSSSAATSGATTGGGSATTTGGSGGTNGTGGSSTGGSSGGSALTGDLAFTVQSSQLFTRHDADGGAMATRLRTKLYGAPLTCAEAQSALPDQDFPWVDINISTSDQTDVAAGTYDVNAPPASHVVGLVYDFHFADGGDAPGIVASSGTITYTTATVDQVAGSFDGVFPLPDGGSATLAGSFGAAYCH